MGCDLPPPSVTGSKSLFPNPQQQQQEEEEVKRRPLLDLSATAAGKKENEGMLTWVPFMFFEQKGQKRRAPGIERKGGNGG